MKKQLLITFAIVLSLPLAAQLVTPVQDGDIYSITIGNVYFEVDASFGGRISAFSINGNDVLYPSQGGEDFLWGSTLWPSPQSWPWPPPFDALEYDPYTGSIQDNKIVVTSATDTYTKLIFEKTYYGNASDSSISIEYKLINKGTNAKNVAAWEVTRVPSGGITFFPKGEGNPWGAFANQFELIDGIEWWEHDNSDPGNQKMFSDGADKWFAHVNEDNILFVKVFEEDVPYAEMAPNEAEIELWHAGISTYIELENQSSYVSIPSGDSMNYNLRWILKEIPDSVDASYGSASLKDFAAYLAGIPFDPSGVKEIAGKPLGVYPNPATGFITLVGTGKEPASVQLFDLTGKNVLSEDGLSPGERLDISSLPGGLYLYRTSKNGTVRSGKLVIE